MIRFSAAALLLLLAASAHHVNAFGGFFGRKELERELTSSGDAIVLGVDHMDDGTKKVHLQVQMEYKGGETDENFGWIIPLPSTPTNVGVGSSLLFHALFQETLPRFELDIETNNLADTTVSRSGTAAAGLQVCENNVLFDQNCPIQGPTRGTPTRGTSLAATVADTGRAGVLEYTVLQGSKDAVKNWLKEHDFLATSNGNIDNVLNYYDALETVYVAVRVAPDTPVGAIQPIMVEYNLPATTQTHKIPTLMAITDTPTALQVYFLSNSVDHRAVPVNYLDVTLDDAFVDWVGCLDKDPNIDECYYRDYQQRFATAVKEVNNLTVTTEYFGQASVVKDKIGIDLAPADLETSANWLEFLTKLEAAGVPPIPPVQGVLDTYLPPDNFLYEYPFECSQWEHIYQPFRGDVTPDMEDCFKIWDPPAGWSWNPVALTAALEEAILAPARVAEQSVGGYISLTRLYGNLLAPASSPEPYFTFRTGQPLVDSVHRASAVPLCDLNSPAALEITLQNQQGTTFWQQAKLVCPTWQKTAPRPVFSAEDAAPRSNSMASSFAALGAAQNEQILIPRNEDGYYEPADINAALEQSNAALGALTADDAPADGVQQFPGIPMSGTLYIENLPPPEEDEFWAQNGSAGVSFMQSMSMAVVTMVVAMIAGFLPTRW